MIDQQEKIDELDEDDKNLNETLRELSESLDILKRNECDSSPCLNGGECVDRYNDFECVCSSMFGGKTCNEALFRCPTEKTGYRYIPSQS